MVVLKKTKGETHMKFEITMNNQFKSVEVKFDAKPSQAVIEKLKALKFRWHSVKQLWYGYAEREAVESVLNGENKTASDKPTKTKTPEIKEVKGLKVGDLLVASWGWEQTNITVVQVIALCGTSSVRVREVAPIVKSVDGIGWASEDLTLATTDKILEPRKSSVFIKDQDKGDLKRVQEFRKGQPSVILADYANAYKLTDGEKFYHSWYA